MPALKTWHATWFWLGPPKTGPEANKDAAWYYPETKDAAKHIAGRIAFWKGVEIEA